MMYTSANQKAVSLNLHRYTTGTAAAAHTISAQMFQLGVIAILALSTLAAILIPQRVNKAVEEGGGLLEAKKMADRLLVWGFLLGCFLGAIQACSLPMLKFFTPLEVGPLTPGGRPGGVRFCVHVDPV
jgi:Na+-driven multidrug efflux pump